MSTNRELQARAQSKSIVFKTIFGIWATEKTVKISKNLAFDLNIFQKINTSDSIIICVIRYTNHAQTKYLGGNTCHIGPSKSSPTEVRT